MVLPQSCADRVDVGQLDSLSVCGLRILNMQERVERLNGSFHIDSSHSNGSVITIDFPITSINDEDKYVYKNSSS